jgi:hypothetical protein
MDNARQCQRCKKWFVTVRTKILLTVVRQAEQWINHPEIILSQCATLLIFGPLDDDEAPAPLPPPPPPPPPPGRVSAMVNSMRMMLEVEEVMEEEILNATNDIAEAGAIGINGQCSNMQSMYPATRSSPLHRNKCHTSDFEWSKKLSRASIKPNSLQWLLSCLPPMPRSPRMCQRWSFQTRFGKRHANQ